VEAKRAVPRSETPREVGSKPGSNSPSTKSTQLGGNLSLESGLNSSHLYDPALSRASFGANDYSFNKIFVGGLHYDTRDGKFIILLLLLLIL
jgi:hypothetical protein